jgi:hypothetical protein
MPSVNERQYKVGEVTITHDEVRAMTPEERLCLQWAISKSEWMARNGTTEEPEFRRDVARVIRPGR